MWNALVCIVGWLWSTQIEFLCCDAEGALQKSPWCHPAGIGAGSGTRQCPCSGDVGSSAPTFSTSLSVLMLQQSLPVVPPRGLEITNNYFFWNVCKMTLYFRNFHFFKIWICDFSELCDYQVIEFKATTDVSCIKKCLRELMILSDYSCGSEREGFISAFPIKAGMTPKE